MKKVENFRAYLQKTCPALLNFDTAALLSGYIADYEQPVIRDSYALVQISKEIHRMVRETEPDRPDTSRFCHSNYILAFNRDPNRMSFERFFTYFYNFAGIDLSDIIISIVDTDSQQCELRNKKFTGVEYTIAAIDMFFSLEKHNSAQPNMDDFDIRLILDKINEKNDGSHFFKFSSGYNAYSGEISSSNYDNNISFRTKTPEILQLHEKTITDRMLSHPNYQGSRADAVVDLALAGYDANLAVLTENPMMALYTACVVCDEWHACFTSLPKSALEIREEIVYPADADFILRPDAVHMKSAAMQARSGVFAYCHKGRLYNSDHGGVIENIQIPHEAAKLLLEHTGLNEYDVYPDVGSLLLESRFRKSSAGD